MLFLFLFLNNHMNKQNCVSVSNWLEYTFLDFPLIENGVCVVNHVLKSTQMSETCTEQLPSIECYHNATTKLITD